MLERIRPMLESRRLPMIAALLAIALTSPSLAGGLATEDWVQRDLIRDGAFPLPSRINLFGHDRSWGPADVARRDFEYQLYGWFPWVTDRHFDASFWRPIASLTHHLDYRVFPGLHWLMHLESLLWYGLLAYAVAIFHRRLFAPRWLAGLSALLYAADDAHGHPVGWLMNRNGVMAAAFSVLALWAYDRFRRDGWRPGAALTILFFGLGLCSAEFALCAAGYFVAYAVFVDGAPLRRRAVASLAWVLPLAMWAFAYRALGHTTRGSGLYIDPGANPVAYAFEMTERGVVLLMGQLGAPFSDLWSRSEPYEQGFIVFWAVVFLWWVVHVFRPLVARDPQLRFWLAGLLLSLPPACATFPEDRLLLLAGVGAFPLIAATVGAAVEAVTEGKALPRSATALAAAFALLHGGLAPLLLPYRSLHMMRYDRAIEDAAESAFVGLDKKRGDSLIVVNSENFYFASMMPVVRVARDAPTVTRMMTLAGTLEDVTLRRVAENQIEVRPAHGFLAHAFNRIHRSRTLPFTRGGSIDLLGVQITIAEVDQWGEPTAAVFQFAQPLDDPRYHWVAWRNGRYEPFHPPTLGTSVVVRGS